MLKQDLTLQNYELKKPLPIEKNSKVISVTKDELYGKNMKESI